MVEEKLGARNGEQERNKKEVVEDEVKKIMKESDKQVVKKVTEMITSIFVLFLMFILVAATFFVGVAYLTICAKISYDISRHVWSLW